MKLLLAFPVALGLLAQQQPFTPPADLDFGKATIVSEGTRMAAETYALKSEAGKRLPCILMAHGWGGTAAALRREAAAFAKAGYFVTAFDYRGWGASESRVILTQAAPSDKSGGKFTAEVQEVREVVDPIDMGTDWLNALHWLAGEPRCDAGRIGIWGSSFSGGLVVYAAARDQRVKALHSQVGSLDARFVVQAETERKKTYDEATRMARGELGYPAPGAKIIGNLRGAPVRAKFAVYAPVEEVNNARQCAMQFVIAEKEELFDNKDHAIKAYNVFQGQKRLINIPEIQHYGIYNNAAARERSQQLAVEWFDKYVKNGGK